MTTTHTEGHFAVKDALKSTPIMLATAEHEYSRYGYKQLLDKRVVDILQPVIILGLQSGTLFILCIQS